MINTTNSASILEHYLIKRSELEIDSLIENLRKQFPRRTSPQLIERICEELRLQNQSKVSRIINNINSQFDIPVRELLVEAAESPDLVKKSKLVELTEELQSLRSKLQSQESNIDSDSATIIKEINGLIDVLDTVELDQADDYIHMIEDAIHKVTEISSTLDLSYT